MSTFFYPKLFSMTFTHPTSRKKFNLIFGKHFWNTPIWGPMEAKMGCWPKWPSCSSNNHFYQKYKSRTILKAYKVFLSTFFYPKLFSMTSTYPTSWKKFNLIFSKHFWNTPIWSTMGAKMECWPKWPSWSPNTHFYQKCKYRSFLKAYKFFCPFFLYTKRF